jgi:hypothetical protein
MNRSNKAFIPLIFCFWALTGCRSHIDHVQWSADVTSKKAHKEDTITIKDLDTSMLSLKSVVRVSMTDLLSQPWQLEDADQPHWNEIFWDSSINARMYPEIALFKDMTVTVNAHSRIQMGKWQLNKEAGELALRFDDGTSNLYKIDRAALRQMEMNWVRVNDNVFLQLSAQAIVHKQPEKDPLHPSNNRWRIRPAKPETAEQIRSRVKGCVHFFALYFRDNHLRQETDISFIGLPCCFIWYNGGIGIQNEMDLDRKWIACFYSEAQALTGYKMLVPILQSHTLHWPEHPTSWVGQTGDVLQEMADKLGR